MHVYPSIYIYKINTQNKFFPHADAGTGDTSNGHEIKERFNMHLQRVDRHPMRTVLVCLAEQVLVAFNRVSRDAFPSPQNLSTCRNVTCHKPCSMSTASPIWSMHASHATKWNLRARLRMPGSFSQARARSVEESCISISTSDMPAPAASMAAEKRTSQC